VRVMGGPLDSRLYRAVNRVSDVRVIRLATEAARVAKSVAGLGPVGIHREFITAATRWIMEAKL
jgi:hypothetical protein